MTQEQDVHRHHPQAARQYRNDEIVVYWEPDICIHEAECLRRLPSVFDTRARPWVDISGAAADAIAATIAACPSGALSFERLDGGPIEEVPPATTIEPQEDGPLWVRGRIEIRNADGSVRQATRAALCRCGASENKPYCDLSHRMIGFKAP
jgi:uncharacterized Fe-S cluster protein YjdI